MKKYLMTGFAAIAFCAAFTSCSKGDDVYDPNRTPTTDNTNASYAEAFIKTFGKPAANQDWGFGTAKASTRSGNTGETYAQTHGDENGGCNMNHNEWADPDKEFGGWEVVPELTPKQKAVVTAYFQNNPNPEFDDPHYRHFFVQQVYGGGNETIGKTTEGITAADNSTASSKDMNLLTVGAAHIHINDFNAGNCGESDVLDNGQKVGGSSHKDQITLMVNIDDTSCFGYHETASSTHHDNKAYLVSWETIAAWGVKNGYPNAEEDLNDGYNRSFLGFDLALQEGEQAMNKDADGNVIGATYRQCAETPQYAWDGEKIVKIFDGWKTEHIVYSEWYEANVDVPNYLEGYEYITKADGSAIGFLTTNQNFYVAGEKKTYDQTTSVSRADVSTLSADNPVQSAVIKDLMDGDTYYQAVVNLPFIRNMVADGYLPVNDKTMAEWVKVGTSDGYYSDWIVTLTEAKRISTDPDPDPVYTIRVIGEDLSAQEEGDFDFNDVVFDVALNVPGKTYIKLKAAGGTLPLIVGVEEPQKGENYDANEVHHLYGKSTKTMINTRVSQKSELIAQGVSYADNQPDVILELDKAYENAKDIPVYVQKGGEWIELTAERGEPASKIGVTTSFRWVTETEFIGDKNWYPLFTEWVTKNSGSWYQGDNEKK